MMMPAWQTSKPAANKEGESKSKKSCRKNRFTSLADMDANDVGKHELVPSVEDSDLHSVNTSIFGLSVPVIYLGLSPTIRCVRPDVEGAMFIMSHSIIHSFLTMILSSPFTS